MGHFLFAFLFFSLKRACKAISFFPLSIFLSFILSPCASRELCSSYLLIVARSFNSLISATMLLNLVVKEHKIFTTTYYYVIVSPHAFTWFTNRVILVAKSLM